MLKVINGNLVEVNKDGSMLIIGSKAMIDRMVSPVKCHYCGKVYDLTKTKVIHRSTNCTIFKTSCCKKQADDRSSKMLLDFTHLN